MKEILRARVQKGVEKLDTFKPGWRTLVHPGNLNMGSSMFCVLGQVFGSFSRALRELLGTDAQGPSVAHGFELNDEEMGHYDLLNEIWREELAKAPAEVAP